MNLQDYPRPANDNGLGIHLSAGNYPLGEDEGSFIYQDGAWGQQMQWLLEMKIKWAKVIDQFGMSYNAVRALQRAGIMPIVRLYRPRPNPGTLDAKQLDVLKLLTVGLPGVPGLGVRYFETNNEPNLHGEWQNDAMPPLQDAVRAVVRDFIVDADHVLAVGGLPGFPAMAPTDGSQDTRAAMLEPGFSRPNYNAILFFELAMQEIKRLGRADIFERGGWLSCHPAGLNHDPIYPDSAPEQAEHPGSTIHRHWYPDTGLPTGASNCWRMYEALEKIFYDTFGFVVPVLGTEGGWWAYKADDTRYPPMDINRQADYTLEVHRWFRDGKMPAYMFCSGHWLWANRIAGNLNQPFEADAWWGLPGFGSRPQKYPEFLPIVDRLKAEPAFVRVFDPDVEFFPPVTPPPPPGAPTLTDADRREVQALAWLTIGVDLNRDAALYNFARPSTVSEPRSPRTQERPFIARDGSRWIWQGWDGCILVVPVDHWDQVQMIAWVQA